MTGVERPRRSATPFIVLGRDCPCESPKAHSKCRSQHRLGFADRPRLACFPAWRQCGLQRVEALNVAGRREQITSVANS